MYRNKQVCIDLSKFDYILAYCNFPLTHETFIATHIAIFDENRLKPNTDKGLSPVTTPIDFSALL